MNKNISRPAKRTYTPGRHVQPSISLLVSIRRRNDNASRNENTRPVVAVLPLCIAIPSLAIGSRGTCTRCRESAGWNRCFSASAINNLFPARVIAYSLHMHATSCFPGLFRPAALNDLGESFADGHATRKSHGVFLKLISRNKYRASDEPR